MHAALCPLIALHPIVHTIPRTTFTINQLTAGHFSNSIQRRFAYTDFISHNSRVFTTSMADSVADRCASQRDSDISLGLVGIPSIQKSAQPVNEFDFDFDLEAGLDTELDAHINSYFNNAGITEGQSVNDVDITLLTPVKTSFNSSECFQAYPTHGQYPQAVDHIDYSIWPAQQNFQYSEPQNYYMPHEAPYFNQGFDSVDPYGHLSGNLGLTAIPGNSAVAGYGTAQYPPQSYAYPTESWTYQSGDSAFLMDNTSYLPVNAPAYTDSTAQYTTSPHGEPLAMIESQVMVTDPDLVEESSISSTTTVERSEQQDTPDSESDSDSDDDYQETEHKVTKAANEAKRKQLRSHSMSSDGNISPSEPVKYQPGEKPKKVDAKPWIRTNANTEGDTRTAKINNWKNKYQYKSLLLGDWSSGKHTFKYTKYENVDFLTEAPMSTRKIKEYIMNYPSDNSRRLVLRVQKMPADQGRRYGSKQHSKCVFKDCPIQRYVEGTISTGEYRVAFDEKSYTYGNEIDPYDCTAYAHLYCMEQFLDFEQVCKVSDVRIDTRLDMPLEPNGRAAFSMVDVPARHEMERFVKAASKGNLRSTQRWNNYPVHADYDRTQQKPHEDTLTYLAHRMYEAHQDDSHKKQAALRRVTVSQRRVHLGDLEMSVADKRIMIEAFGGKKKSRKGGKVEDHYDEHIRYQINRAKKEAEEFLAGKLQAQKSGRKGRKRKAVQREEIDDEEPVHEQNLTANTRASRHKKQRVNYAESPEDIQYGYADSWYAQPQPSHGPAQLHQLQTYMAANNSYEQAPVHIQMPVDPALGNTLNTAYGLYAVPATPSLDISNFPTCEANIPDDNLEKLLALERRQSCAAELGPMSILKSPELTRGGRRPRRALFGAQPVSSSKEYFVNDPPSLVAGAEDVPMVDADESERRSARIAAKSGPQCVRTRVQRS